MNSRKRLRRQYESLSRRTAEILADEDLIRITDGNPDPIGEYSGEATEIIRRVIVAQRSPQIVDREFIARVVSDVFKSQFEVDICADEAIRIASRIEAELN